MGYFKGSLWKIDIIQQYYLEVFQDHLRWISNFVRDTDGWVLVLTVNPLKLCHILSVYLVCILDSL